MKKVYNSAITTVSFLLTGLTQIVSGLANTTQILITGDFRTTNISSSDYQVSEPVHWGMAVLLMGTFLIEISVLNSLKKIFLAENIEQASRSHLHATIRSVAMAGCCSAMLRLENLTDPAQTGEIALGLLHPNFLFADLLLFSQIRRAIREVEQNGLVDNRELNTYTIVPLTKILMIICSGVLQAKKVAFKFYGADSGIDIEADSRIQFSSIFIILRIGIDFITKQITFTDVKSVMNDYNCCFFQQPIANHQQIQQNQNQLNQPLLQA